MEKQMDSIQSAVKKILECNGEDCTREGLRETPKRVEKANKELFNGYNMEVKLTAFDEECDQIIMLKNIEFYSTCEHHTIPFYGRAHIAYIPNGKVLGISKLARLLDKHANRYQIQERMTEDIVKEIEEALSYSTELIYNGPDAIIEKKKPLGVAIVVEGIHLCMRARGVKKQNSVMVTAKMTGKFMENVHTRAEFYSLINTPNFN